MSRDHRTGFFSPGTVTRVHPRRNTPSNSHCKKGAIPIDGTALLSSLSKPSSDSHALAFSLSKNASCLAGRLPSKAGTAEFVTTYLTTAVRSPLTISARSINELCEFVSLLYPCVTDCRTERNNTHNTRIICTCYQASAAVASRDA